MITERQVLGMFVEGLQQDTSMGWLDAIATSPIRSDQDSEEYNWLGQVPQLVEKTGSKRFEGLNDFEWIVRNLPYQNGLRFDEDVINFDKTDQVRMRVREFAQRSSTHWSSLCAPLILAGESSVCYDGQYFFDTDHSEGDSGAQSNDISVDISALPVSNHGSTTAPSTGEAIHTIMKGVETLISFKDDQGEYCNENYNDFLILCGTGLMTPLMAGLKAKSVDGGDDNILVEQDSYSLRIKASPRFNAWTTKFGIFATQGVQKPLIRQQKIPNNSGSNFNAAGFAIESLWLGSEYCILNDECLMSAETVRAAAYGDWKKACLVTMA